MTRARVLVMDDDPLFRSLLAATLRKEYLVSVAIDGADGYAKAVEHAPDLAVVDLQMPVCDGLGVLRLFRAHPTLCSVPVVMLTGDNSKGSVVTAIQHGVNDYIIKTSFNRQDFLQKISRLLPKGQQAIVATPDAQSPAEGPRPSETPTPVEGLRQSDPAPEAAPVAEKQLQSILDNWD